MKTPTKLWHIVLCPCITLLCLYLWLVVGNGFLLYTLQDHSLFLPTDSFLEHWLAMPMGICTWMGAFLTQFFYYPALGAFLLIFLWCFIWGILYLLLRPKGYSTLFLLVPVCALLLSITDLGYWVYSLKDPGYAFTHSLAFFFCLLLVEAGKRISTSKAGIWLFAVSFPILAYPLCGWYMILGSALVLLLIGKKQNLLPCFLLFVLTIVIPWCWVQVYTTVPVADAWTAGFPVFNNNGAGNLRPQIPFYILILSTLALGVMNRLSCMDKINHKIALGVLCASLFSAYYFSFRNANFHREMRMYKAADEGRWEDVLQEVRPGGPAATQQIALLRNVALLNLGKIDELLNYDAWRVDFNLRDEMYHNIIQMGIPYIYYQYGQLHHATRWAIELSVEYGYSVQTLKTLLRCAKLTGEKELEKRYRDLLDQTLFYKNWQEKPAAHITTLYKDTPEELTNDANLCERFLLTHFMIQQGEASDLTHNLSLWSAMLMKNVSYFWYHYRYYHEEGKTNLLPLPALQAAAMLGTLSGQDISELQLPQDIVQQYNTFQQKFTELNATGNSKQQTALALLPEYGHTYWWYYCFGPDEY